MLFYGIIKNGNQKKKGENSYMKQNMIVFEDYNITVDTEEIKNMEKEELTKCKQKIQEIQNLLEK